MDLSERLASAESLALITIREAGAGDQEAIHELLELNDLHAAGILTSGSRYWVAQSQAAEVVGCVGLEYGPHAVLLRSAAVRPEFHGRGIGSLLFAHAFEQAAIDQRTAVFLFSTDAGEFWTRQGFRQVPVAELCAALPDAFQVHYYVELGWLPTEIAWRRDIG